MSLSKTASPGRADLHMHTTVSDGTVSVQHLLDAIARKGKLNVIAVTDHDRLDASLWAYAHRHRYPFEVVPGVEISSVHGHILGLWVMHPIPAGLSAAETTAAIHEQGGLAVLAHPFHVQLGFVARTAPLYWRDPGLLNTWGLDAVEVHNAGVVIPGSNLLARWLARRAGLPALGNSDAHTPGAVGSGRTRFPGQTAADLRAAIHNRQTVAQGGAWAPREYSRFIRAMIARRGKLHPNGDLDFLDFELELDFEAETPAPQM